MNLIPHLLNPDNGACQKHPSADPAEEEER